MYFTNHLANNFISFVSIFRSNCICAQIICDNKYDNQYPVVWRLTGIVNSTNQIKINNIVHGMQVANIAS